MHFHWWTQIRFPIITATFFNENNLKKKSFYFKYSFLSPHFCVSGTNIKALIAFKYCELEKIPTLNRRHEIISDLLSGFLRKMLLLLFYGRFADVLKWKLYENKKKIFIQILSVVA